MSERTRFISARRITVPSLLALAAGFLVGLFALNTKAPFLLQAAGVAATVGAVWTNALRMVVLPLMVSYIVIAINSAQHPRAAGRLGGMALASYLAMLVTVAIFTFAIGSQLLSMMPIDDAARAAFRAMPGAPPNVVPRDATSSTAQWIVSLVPSNPLRAATEENYLALIIATVLFSLAMTRIAPERRRLLGDAFTAIAETSGVIIGWIISVLPVAAFALAFSIGASSGLSVAGSIGWFIVGLCVLLVVCLIALYPLTVLLAKVRFRDFAQAAVPAQTVAAGTRSSLACLPALLEGAEAHLNLPAQATGFVLPLSVSTFKLNYLISQPFKMLFLASMFGLHLSPGFLISFTATTILLSFTTAGVPSGGQLLTWPLFMAAGVPVQALVVLKVADAIPDILKTVLNVTADLSVAAIIARFSTREVPAAAALASR